jgi:hypothetical protein
VRSVTAGLARKAMREDRRHGTRTLVVATALASAALVVLAHVLLAVGAAPGRWGDVSPSRSLDRSQFSWDQILSTHDERTVVALVVHAQAPDEAPVPPGVTRFPHAGEAFVSPALRAAIRADPTLAGRVPGEIVGTIGDDGLVAPDELRVIAAVSDPGGLYGGWSWGTRDIEAVGLVPGGETALVLALLWGLPAVVALAACGHAYAGRLRRRLARLRVLGASRGDLLEYVRSYVVRSCAPAAGVGVLAGTCAVALLSRTGVVGIAFFSPGLVVSGLVAAAVLGLALLGVGAAGAVAARPLLADAYRAVRGADRSRGRLAPLLAAVGGSVLLGIAATRWAVADQHAPGPVVSLVFLAAAAMLVVGTALSAGHLARWWVARRDRDGVEAQLVWRQLAYEPVPLAIATFAMTVVAIVLAITVAVLQLVLVPQAEGRGWWTVTIAGATQPDLPAVLEAVGDGATLVAEDRSSATMWATCAVIAAGFGPTVAQDRPCQDGRSYRADDLVTQAGERLAPFVGEPSIIRTDDPRTAPASVPQGANIYLAVRPDDLDAMQSAVLAAAPTAAFTPVAGDAGAAALAPSLERLTTRAASVGAVLGVVAVLVSIAASPIAAAGENRLRRIGATRRTVRRLRGRRAATTTAVGGVLGSVVALVVELGYLALGSRYVPDITTGAVLVGLVALATLIAAFSGRATVPGDRAGRGSPRRGTVSWRRG